MGLEINMLLELVEDVKANVAETKKELFATLKKGAEELESEIEDEMARDTGKSAASWGHYNANHLQMAPWRNLSPSEYQRWLERRASSSEADSIWEEDPEHLSIKEGSHVDTVLYIEAGHSQQSPQGFIELLATKKEIELAEKLGSTLSIQLLKKR